MLENENIAIEEKAMLCLWKNRWGRAQERDYKAQELSGMILHLLRVFMGVCTLMQKSMDYGLYDVNLYSRLYFN